MEMGVPAAAAELGVTEEAIRVRLRNGELRGRRVRVGRRDRWFIDAADVAMWKRRRIIAGAAVPGEVLLPGEVSRAGMSSVGVGAVVGDGVQGRPPALGVLQGGVSGGVSPTSALAAGGGSLSSGGSVPGGASPVANQAVVGTVDVRTGGDLEVELVRLRREVKVLRAALYELIGPDRWPVS
jgi:hypothetical protein